MFFYLIHNSTLIERELDEKNKYIKIFLYGGISYIVLHATLFIGGEEALLYSLQKYFWLFFLLDIMIIYLTNSDKKNIVECITDIFSKKHKNIDVNQNNLNSYANQGDHNRNQRNHNTFNSDDNKYTNQNNSNKFKAKKKVRFSDPIEYNRIIKSNEYDSDSDSELGTDIDIEGFKESLNF